MKLTAAQPPKAAKTTTSAAIPIKILNMVDRTPESVPLLMWENTSLYAERPLWVEVAAQPPAVNLHLKLPRVLHRKYPAKKAVSDWLYNNDSRV